MERADSLQLYLEACQEVKKSIPVQQRGIRIGIQNSSSYGRGDLNAALESYYVRIVNMIFYELMAKRNSRVLSYLCSQIGIQPDLKNFEIISARVNNNREGTYDLIPFLDGSCQAFAGNLNNCGDLYLRRYEQSCFRGNILENDPNSIVQVQNAMRALDEMIGKFLLAGAKKYGEELKQGEAPEEQKRREKPDIVFRVHDAKLTDQLNQSAENRRANDAALSEQIQQLQLSIQDGLKQIMEIREGIDYNITKEAISQFISLFSLVSETLKYHPNDTNKDSYYNLIESCEDFLGNILQSLAMLGVTVINDIGKPFDPEKHKAVRGVRPERTAIISRVVKIGFMYKNKVLEKAVVELT